MSAIQRATVALTSTILLLALFARLCCRPLLWHRLRRKSAAKTRKGNVCAQNSMALVGLTHISTEADVTSGKREHGRSEGWHTQGRPAAFSAQQYLHAQHTADDDVVRTEDPAVVSSQAKLTRDGPNSVGKAVYSCTSLKKKRHAAVNSSADIAAVLPTRTRLVHPHTDVHTVGSSSAWETLPLPPQPAPQQPVAGATAKEELAYICKQLDAFGRRGILLKQFEMLGGVVRCIGGQAVVQFVRALRNNNLYAIKLFASRAAYDDEKHLYVNFFPGFMPTVLQFVDNDDGSFKDPFCNPMPPCIVMEKGESLTDHTMCRKCDILTTVQIIGQVANCLSELHSRGWVHRDLKPGNIMFLPRTSSWTLIDFGLAARTGEKACLGFTLVYAAPEVIMAANEGFKAVTADPAMDAWALGVMAFELLTGRPIFRQMIDSTDDLEKQLLGEAPLPWEEDRLTSDTKRRLGAISDPVLRMLCRDPVQRASCKDLAAALQAVISGTSTADTQGNIIHVSPM